MPTFAYKGVDASKTSVTGEIEAVDRRQAMQRLRAKRIQPLQIRLADSGKGGKSGKSVRETRVVDEDDASIGVEKATSSGGIMARLSSGKNLALPFFKKLLQLHSSGMPVGDAVSLMSQRMTDPKLKDLCQRVFKDLSEGRTLAASMRTMPEHFDDTMTYLLEAGEATGNVVPILTNIIDSLEQNAELKRKVRSAMAYPILICSVAFGVIGLFLFFLLPRIESMMASLGGELNIAARFMIGSSDFALKQGPFILAGLIVGGLSLYQWRRTDKGREKTDRWLLRLPMLKQVFYNNDLCRVTNVMTILLGNGINTTESLRLAENTLQNRVLLRRFQASRQLINDGAPFTSAFRKHAFLPELDLDILSIGENTGSMVGSFEEIYRTHAQELSDRLKFLTTLVAGLALTFAFVMVFVLTLGIVLSILNMSQSLLSQ
ncbi:type II secretion system F family protein [Rubellicoccus peritrichatus]|uniref:Type II secretion system F family protein n=1 Tax=Rubellicoccus peritrichatus TaxID=3080537 RepID=A0AAQ3L6L8_9BACT|nr:type II secretion system F family protein [Puniceicoccus sp. CR14]WOO40031.1 type II secretion system F family protein [Puniceicoccus sp. CR14]